MIRDSEEFLLTNQSWRIIFGVLGIILTTSFHSTTSIEEDRERRYRVSPFIFIYNLYLCVFKRHYHPLNHILFLNGTWFNIEVANFYYVRVFDSRTYALLEKLDRMYTSPYTTCLRWSVSTVMIPNLKYQINYNS